VKVTKVCRIPENVEAGRGTYFGSKPHLLYDSYGSKLIIGKYTSIGMEFTAFLGGHHSYQNVTNYTFGRYGNPSYSKGNINIGNDVWIGARVTVLDGLTIGDGAVVGACSMVTKSVPPYTIVGGNPIRYIKMRFSPQVVEDLLRIKWWDWPEERIFDMRELLFQPNIEKFIAACRRLE